MYHFIRHQVEAACEQAFGKSHEVALQVIDIADSPELAEEFNIEALPTLIVGHKRFIGTPTPEMLASYLDVPEATGPADRKGE